MSSQPPTSSTQTHVNGKTYDLKDFEKYHPGGADLLRLAYGNDATALIHSYHKNPEKVLKQLAKYEKKTGVQSQSIQFESDFFKNIKHKVNEYFISTKQPSRGGLLGRTFVILLVSVMLYILALSWSSLFFSGLFGICLAVIGLCIHHDANHGSFSRSAKTNHFFGLAGDLIGSSSLIWRYQHCVNHHVHCNDIHEDEDTRVGLPFFRYFSEHQYAWYMKFQYIYTPVLYALIGVTTPFYSVYEFIKRKHGKVALTSVSRRDRIEFWVMKSIYVIYMFLIPYYVLGFSFIFKFYLPLQLMGGLYLGTLFAANHNNSKVAASMQIKTDDWAIKQIITSGNWASRSLFWNIISGGLNCQIEHHLFPSISHIHYPALHKIIKQACQEKGIPYNDFPTFRAILWDHLIFLKDKGKEQSIEVSIISQ